MKKALLLSIALVLAASDALAAPCQNSGNITSDCDKITAGDNIGTLEQAKVADMDGGVISLVKGSGWPQPGTVQTMAGGTIGTLAEYGQVLEMDGGTIGLIRSGRIGVIRDGTITQMVLGVDTNQERSTITNFFGGTLVTMEGGRVGQLYGTGKITTMNGGTVATMKGGEITTMNGGTVTTMNGGYIPTMNGGSIDGMNGGLVDQLYSGASIAKVNGGEIHTLNDNSSAVFYGTEAGHAKLGKVLDSATATVVSGGFVELPGNYGGFKGKLDVAGTAIVNGETYSDASVNLNLTGGTVWYVAANTAINQVTFASGTPSFAFPEDGSFRTATIGNLISNAPGRFYMNVSNTDLSADHITIADASGTATDHTIYLRTHGANGANLPASATLITTQNGANTLDFTLNGTKAVIGGYYYTLENDTNGPETLWKLLRGTSADAADIVTSTSLSGHLGAGKAATESALNALHLRLGDIRMGKADANGVWVRTYYDHFSFNDLTKTAGDAFGVEAGYDHTVHKTKDGRTVVGASLGYGYTDADTDATLTKDGGSDFDTYGVGFYGTYVGASGLYVDGIFRYFRQTGDGHFYDASDTKYTYKTGQDIFALSAETGYEFKVDRYFVTPRTEWTYANIGSDGFTDSAGIAGKVDSADSFQGLIGVLAGLELENGIKPYAKMSYIYEFAGKTDFTYDGIGAKSDLSGGRFELGTGVIAPVTENGSVYFDAKWRTGVHSYDMFGLNLGFRLAF